jgi:Protein of unknown function (DUF2946)
MDDIVRQALSKWPNVPACYGWLGLDARGDWYLRDDQVQAQGAFAQYKGSRLEHDKLIGFIARNYDHDSAGCWYFQNGPQRVYVELEMTPWIWRLQPDGSIHSHTGVLAHLMHCFVDEVGHLYLQTDLGYGLVHTQDVAQAADHVEQGQWVPQTLERAAMPIRFGYQASPQQTQKNRP